MQKRNGSKWIAVNTAFHQNQLVGFDYDALFKSFNLTDLSADDAANVYEFFGSGDDSSFLTRATVPIVTPNSNAASASGTHDTDTIKVGHVDRNDAQANPNTYVGNEAPTDPINIESSSSGTQDMGELSTNLDSEIQEPEIPETRVHKNPPINNIIGDHHACVQTRHRTIAENTSLYSEILDTGVMKTCLHAAFMSQLEPKNVKEALTDNCWIEAMQDELSQFQKLHVWDLVNLPRGVQPIGTKWVFKCKTDDHHVIVKNKARVLSCMEKFMKRSIVTQPPGFEDPYNINKVYKLDKELYGLYQAPQAWEFEWVMKSKFEMSNMGELSFFLGLQVSQREDGIYLHQTKYVQDILSKYKMNDSSTYGTPIPANHGLHPDKDGKDVDCKLYRGMIGSLMYLTASRPDIMFAHQSFDLKPYTDSDYGGCNLDRKLTSGGCQFLGDRMVSWQCKKQSTVSVSTCEAEYITSASGCSQILWIQQQLRDYGLNFTGTPLFIDNNATMSTTNNPVKHSKTKHIKIRHHFIRDCAEKHLIELVKVYRDGNFADLFTKAFDRNRFEHLVNLIGMLNPE
ncbi:hypothetical protein L1987_09459 [Smallanthus sonchifolius]|uniref:Uncharacterized protein n=1 Tax=Smallanthus sonchifolius TaxID=185202 RepID=A0ACB9JNX2_9ASTR|nr:hypothetical protein L1987_09459 [Smallanthus sonchifolius]